VVRPKLAVWKFASCDGCQLSILDCEDELIALAERVHIANFPEASRAVVGGPYHLSLVEGSMTTPHDAAKIHEIRKTSKYVVAIGACATAGGIQALRNAARVSDYVKVVYARPDYIDTLETSMPISSFVHVDYELHGCPVDKGQLLEVIGAFASDRVPHLPSHSVCMECKMSGTPCVLVTKGEPCLGPVTRTGCGALCPRYARGCFGCFGPNDTPQTEQLGDRFVQLGVPGRDIQRLFSTYNTAADAFERESKRHG